jgi:hypothetical protein
MNLSSFRGTIMAHRWVWSGHAGSSIDYRCKNKRFWLSAHNCQVPTPTPQYLEVEPEIRIFGAD